MDGYTDSTGRAVAVMTAWLTDDPDDTRLSLETMQKILDDDGGNPEPLLTGFVNLCGQMLIRIESRGEEPLDELQEIMRKHHTSGDDA